MQVSIRCIDCYETSRTTEKIQNHEVQVHDKITHRTTDKIKNGETIDKNDDKSIKGE